MVNYEGVMAGNYRTGMSGSDFNRVWDFPDQQLHEPVYLVKKWVKEAAENYDFKLILDLHGHSKKFLFTLLDL